MTNADTNGSFKQSIRLAEKGEGNDRGLGKCISMGRILPDLMSKLANKPTYSDIRKEKNGENKR